MNVLQRGIDFFYRQKVKPAISEISEYRNIEGWLTDQEAFGLYSMAGKVKPNGIIVEIGSWKGKSTFCLAKGLKNGKIFAIDPFNAEGEPGSIEIYEKTKGDKPLIEQFSDAMKQLGVFEKINILNGYSKEFVNTFKEIDFLFIDGDHSIEGCDFDFLSYSPLIIKGGFIAFHDFDSERNDLGPTWVIKNRIDNSKFRFYKRYDTLWVGKKLV
jgi:predicted O-methyltransferase YrrM